MKMVDPQQRVYWDLLTFALVIVSAFEIPYGLLVGYENAFTERIFDLTFALVFGMDILLNCITIRHERFGGLFDWRVVVGAFIRRLSPRAKQLEAGRRPRLIANQPAVATSYLLSGWFVIDLLATIPWAVLFSSGGSSVLGMSRTLRLLRIARLLRILRFAKGFNSIEAVRRTVQAYPSLGRLLATLIVMPWLAHLMASGLVWAERGNEGTPIGAYADGIYHVGLMFIAGEPITDLTAAGRVIGVLGVILSLTFIGTLIANLTALFAATDNKRATRSNETYTGHTLILGYDASIYAILQQLATDDEGKSDDVVILANRPTEDMWHLIAAHCPGIRKRTLHIRRGDYTSSTLLEKLSIHEAQQVIVLGDAEGTAGAAHGLTDIRVLKGILASCQALKRGREALTSSLYGGGPEGTQTMGHSVPIVATVGSESAAAVLNQGIPADLNRNASIHVVDTASMTDRILTQVINQPPLAAVYLDLLSYEADGEREGAEIYCVPLNARTEGRSFAALASGYTHAIPIGYIADGQTVLNPKPGSAEAARSLAIDDTMVLVAPSRDATAWEDRTPHESVTPIPHRPATRLPRQILVVGMGSVASALVTRLQEFLPEGSTISTWADVHDAGDGHCQVEKIDASAISFDEGDSKVVKLITNGLGGMRHAFDTIVLVPSAEDPAVHDAEVLMGLTALGAHRSDDNNRATVIVDLLDARNVEMASLFNDPVVVVSTQLVSNYLVQLAHDPQRGQVFRALMDGSEGAEIYVRPAADYLQPDDTATSFAQSAGLARARNEIAIGYKGSECGLVLAPADRDAPLTSDALSDVIVIADE